MVQNETNCNQTVQGGAVAAVATGLQAAGIND
jgi:hypothetical protein